MSDVFSQPKLVLGEGKVERFFFSELFLKHNLEGFEARHPIVGTDSSGGVDKIGAYLNGLTAGSTFPVVQKIIVVGDNDDAAAFGRVCGELQKANYTVPPGPKQFVQTPDKPELAVLMIPEAFPGCLESLCFAAARDKWPDLVLPFDTYFQVTPAANWIESKRAKMKMQCMLASTCKQNPQVALNDIWQKKEQYQIPLNNPAFQGIVDFLRSV